MFLTGLGIFALVILVGRAVSSRHNEEEYDHSSKNREVINLTDTPSSNDVNWLPNSGWLQRTNGQSTNCQNIYLKPN